MRVWRYVITNDSGFAPNFESPYATLATCKPGIRRAARPDDLIVAFNGERLVSGEPHSVRWAGIVGGVMPLGVYRDDPRFQGKKPTQHGGQRAGGAPDNIYRPYVVGQLEQVENGSHGVESAATDIGGRNALVFKRSWYFGPSVANLHAHLNLNLGGRRKERHSEIDEPTWRELKDWPDRHEPAPAASVPSNETSGCRRRSTTISRGRPRC